MFLFRIVVKGGVLKLELLHKDEDGKIPSEMLDKLRTTAKKAVSRF